MFQALPLQPPSGQNQSAEPASDSTANGEQILVNIELLIKKYP